MWITLSTVKNIVKIRKISNKKIIIHSKFTGYPHKNNSYPHYVDKNVDNFYLT